MVKKVQLTRQKYQPTVGRSNRFQIVTGDIPVNSVESSVSDKDLMSDKSSKFSQGRNPTPTLTHYMGRGVGAPGVPIPPDLKTSKKNEVSVDEVLQLTENMTLVQKKELLDKLALSLATSQRLNSDRDFEMWFSAVYSALLAHKVDAEGSGVGPLVVKRYLGSLESYGPIKNFMEVTKLTGLQVNERQSVYNLFAGLLVKHAKQVAVKHGFPFSLKALARCTSSISGIVDQAFPGYASAGLMLVVAKQYCSGVSHVDE